MKQSYSYLTTTLPISGYELFMQNGQQVLCEHKSFMDHLINFSSKSELPEVFKAEKRFLEKLFHFYFLFYVFSMLLWCWARFRLDLELLNSELKLVKLYCTNQRFSKEKCVVNKKNGFKDIDIEYISIFTSLDDKQARGMDFSPAPPGLR